MSAADHIHPGQLAMLMPAHQVAEMNYGDAYKQTPESRAHMMDTKRADNARNPMEPHMGKPITVFHRGTTPEIWDGHHRLAHALDTNPNRELLVTHDSDEGVAQRYKAGARMRKMDADRIARKGKR